MPLNKETNQLIILFNTINSFAEIVPSIATYYNAI